MKNKIAPLIIVLQLALSCPAILANTNSKLFGNIADSPLTVNIDNPNFRKLVIAVPLFFIAPDRSSQDAENFAEQAPQTLTSYLEFSGLFNIISEDAYKDLTKKLQEKYRSGGAQGLFNDFGQGLVGGLDIVQWKSIGVESLVIGEVEHSNGKLNLKFHLYDIIKGKKVGGKIYNGIIKGEHIKVMRRVANHIMEAYTGKKGI